LVRKRMSWAPPAATQQGATGVNNYKFFELPLSLWDDNAGKERR
jgi:hypothetical protein